PRSGRLALRAETPCTARGTRSYGTPAVRAGARYLVVTRPAWSIALQWALWAAAMSAIMAWLARSRTHTPPATGAQRLAHPRSTLIIGVVCSLLFSGVALASALWPGKTGSLAITALFLGFSALGVPLILDYRNARH